MPRQLHKITSKENPTKEIRLDSMGYKEALEEALEKLGWQIRSEWDVPYDQLLEDEHMKSLNSQQNTNNTNPET